jgi:HAD superfamily hydrolase (TIGR01509 family)
MRPNPETLVFDFDGVLADTESLYWKAWEILLAPHGVSLSWEDYCRFGRGVKDEQMIERLPQAAADRVLQSRLKEQISYRKEMIRAWFLERPLIGSATAQMLKSLNSFRLALVTSSDRADVEPALRRAGIHSCFQTLVFGEDTDCHKPDPAPYLLIRERLGIETGIAFEDSDAGVESATAAGFTAVRVADPSELPEIVSRSLRVR